MRTSEAAAAAAVNVQTLRYYLRRGLLTEPIRRGAGYRDYDDAGVQRVRFIKRAQDLGFALEEIRELLELREGTRPRGVMRRIAAAKAQDIDERIKQLTAMREALGCLINACERDATARECPIIEALDGASTTVRPAAAVTRARRTRANG